MNRKYSIPKDGSFKDDELGSTRPNLSNQSKGGSVTKSKRVNRKKAVKECMLKNMSITQMVSLGLGSKQTICKDVEEIRKSWETKDIEWFKRAKLARIITEKQLDSQCQLMWSKIDDKKIPIKERLHAISLLSKLIIKKHEISSSMDPDEYLKKQLQEKISSMTKNDF
ncbi:MAG: hypothetical protein WD717_06730 [Nitrosarchaeum sp.]